MLVWNYVMYTRYPRYLDNSNLDISLILILILIGSGALKEAKP